MGIEVCPICMGIGKGFIDTDRVPGPVWRQRLIPAECWRCHGAGVIDPDFETGPEPKPKEWFVR